LKKSEQDVLGEETISVAGAARQDFRDARAVC